MKFAALVLTLLLAVGSQASEVQSDAPTQAEHIRAAALLYLTQVKESATKTLEHLDGTEYAEYKVKLTESLDKLHGYAQTAAQTLGPYGDTFSTQFLAATKEVRERVLADVEALRSNLEPKSEELHQVLQKHAEEYRAQLEPIFQEYLSKHREEVGSLRNKLQPVLDELRAKVEANVEETKSKVEPLVEAVRAKLTEHLEEVRSFAAPYAEEYKEQLTKAISQAGEQVAPHVEEAKSRFSALQLDSYFAAIYESLSQAWN